MTTDMEVYQLISFYEQILLVTLQVNTYLRNFIGNISFVFQFPHLKEIFFDFIRCLELTWVHIFVLVIRIKNY